MFGTAGIRGGLDKVSPSLALRAGRAAGQTADRLVVGRDGRHTGGSLVSAVVAGAESAGCDVTTVGAVPTHVVAWTACDRGAHGLAVTASHNPPQDNGIKLFRPDGGEFDADDEARFEEEVGGTDTADWDGWTEADTAETVGGYVEEAVRHVLDESGEADLRVAVDTANGVGVETTPEVLQRLGCEVVTVNAQVDAAFPGRGSKPTDETLAGFADYVRRRGFDLGLAHDGDADRLVAVDGEGVVSEDAVLAVLARDAVSRRDADTVLTTPNASPRVDDEVRAAGGEVERVPLGTVSERVRGRARDVAFAAEPWKHVFPGFGGWVDGTVAAAKIACLYSEDENIFDGLRDVDVTKVSVDCADEKKDAVTNCVEDELRAGYDADFDTSDGFRADLGDGRWFLVRASGTEPKVRVYAEGDEELVESLVSTVRDSVRRV